MPFSDYQRHRLGHVTIAPEGPLEAGSHAELTITYTAGYFGIDDSGNLKLSWRTASDSGKPQFADPKAPNYTTAEASNGARLHIEYTRSNIRPWVNTLLIRAVGGFLREGETVTIRLGDRRQGSPGYRLQTAVERPFPFRFFVDAFATYDFVALDNPPEIDLVPGRPVRWNAILPTLRTKDQPFRLAVTAEDRWGNPSDRIERTVRLAPSAPIRGLPDSITFHNGDDAVVIDELRAEAAGDLVVDLLDEQGARLGRSNPLRIVDAAKRVHYWGDLHGQSGETVGSGTAAQYFQFARHKSFIDMTAHQGNDFQIEDEFWAEINRLSAEYDQPGRFVAFPAYEWSGNTGMGGDRNVYFMAEGRPIRRSSSVLLKEPKATDCHHVNDLFAALKDEDCVVIPHVGGRYADIEVGHDPRLEPVVEIHSCWGTFEWMLHDAIRLGYRVGIVCHSDDHKGRPGAAWPGAGEFGAKGGLTCYLMDRLDRTAVFEALRARRTYGTTGTRLYLDLEARFAGGCEVLSDDPLKGLPIECVKAETAGIGRIVRTEADEAVLSAEIIGSAPIERLIWFNGTEPVATVRPFDEKTLGRRIRVLFEGAEYRGRGRETRWQGTARLLGNHFTRAGAINLFNADRPLGLAHNGSQIAFDTVTTGNFSGFDLWLDDAEAGELDIVSEVATTRVAIGDIGLDDHIVDCGGLGRRLRLFRLPDANDVVHFRHEQAIPLARGRDNPLYLRVTQEDGHQAWTSPIYVIP